MQGKTEHTHKKLPQSSGSKSKPNDDGPSGAQSPSNQIRKVYLIVTYNFENYTIGHILVAFLFIF